ncbi:hypothetical protein MTO96_037686 [Rhipicephalus appendiculatus]
MNSTYVLKEPADEAAAPSCGDNTRNPLFNSVKKLPRVLDPLAEQGEQEPARARLPWRSEGGGSRSTLDRRPLPRCRRLRELARKVSSRFSGSTNGAFEEDDVAVGAAAATATAASTGYRDPDFASSEEYSMRDPFLRDEGPWDFSVPRLQFRAESSLRDRVHDRGVRGRLVGDGASPPESPCAAFAAL